MIAIQAFIVLSFFTSSCVVVAFTSVTSSFMSKPILQQHKQHAHRTQSSQLQMGMEIKIRIVGRKNGADKWLEDAYSMYETRLRPSTLDVTTIWHKNDSDLAKNVLGDAAKGHTVVLLDPTGKARTSEEFSDTIYDWLDIGGSRLSFVIGGAEGLPPELKYSDGSQYTRSGSSSNSNSSNKGGKGKAAGSGGATSQFELFTLSRLTFTHQFARTLLMEQIYRASEIKKGSGYHK